MDILTHISNLDLFRAECKSKAGEDNKYFSTDEDGNILYNVAKIPVVYSADLTQSVCLIRLVTDEEKDEFDTLTSCERIGICENSEYIFDDGGEDIYNAIYDQTPVTVNADGDTSTYTPPALIGLFA